MGSLLCLLLIALLCCANVVSDLAAESANDNEPGIAYHEASKVGVLSSSSNVGDRTGLIDRVDARSYGLIDPAGDDVESGVGQDKSNDVFSFPIGDTSGASYTYQETVDAPSNVIIGSTGEGVVNEPDHGVSRVDTPSSSLDVNIGDVTDQNFYNVSQSPLSESGNDQANGDDQANGNDQANGSPHKSPDPSDVSTRDTSADSALPSVQVSTQTAAFPPAGGATDELALVLAAKIDENRRLSEELRGVTTQLEELYVVIDTLNATLTTFESTGMDYVTAIAKLEEIYQRDVTALQERLHAAERNATLYENRAHFAKNERTIARLSQENCMLELEAARHTHRDEAEALRAEMKALKAARSATESIPHAGTKVTAKVMWCALYYVADKTSGSAAVTVL
jgi:prefoldin subunit 5